MNGGQFIPITIRQYGLIEYRDFLMFLPSNSTDLKAVLSYYSSYVVVNPEGDVHVSDEARECLAFEVAKKKPSTLQD